MRIDIITLFPQMFGPVLEGSMLGIARERGHLETHLHDLRQWALPGVHRQVDDSPYGGGPGMVLRPEPVFAAVRDVQALAEPHGTVVLMTPQGEPFEQTRAESFAKAERLVLVCGRYEGFDERIRSIADVQLSVGDYVLTGGELPAMVVVDAVSRLLPGVLGGDTSAEEESFSLGLLEYPQYTRPPEFEGMAVPEVLLSGDHARIAAWRREQSIERTARLRPDLLQGTRAAQDGPALAERDTSEAGPAGAEEMR
jgi:tRNA (guanine37-N1)-methyltransferase